jgi:hypothetical protein
MGEVTRRAWPLVVALALLCDSLSPCSSAPSLAVDAHHAALALMHDCGESDVPRLMPRCECGCTRESSSAVGLGPSHPGVLQRAEVLLAPASARVSIAAQAVAVRASGSAIDHVPRLLG